MIANKRKFIAVLCMALFILIVLMACKISPTPKSPIVIVLNDWAGYTVPIFVAQEEGYFKANGVDVELRILPTYESTLREYDSINADGITEVFADTVHGVLNGQDRKAVYVFDRSLGGDALLAMPNISSPKDLKGKTIGIIEFNKFSQLFVLEILKKYGLRERDVFFAQVPAEQAVATLEAGQVQASHTWDPDLLRGIAKGYKVLGTSRETPNLIIDVLSFRQCSIDSRYKDIEGVVHALAQAREFVKVRPMEAAMIAAKATGGDPASVLESLNEIYVPDLKENVEAFDGGNASNTLFNNGNLVAAFNFERGETDLILSPKEMMDKRFVVTALAHEAVRSR